MPISTPGALRPLLSLAATGATVVLLAACGSSDSGGSTATGTSGASASSSSSSGDEDAGRVKLTRCLRENGVDIPDDGGMPSASIDRDKVQAALDGPCKDLASAAGGQLSGADQEEFQDAFAKFSQCMRDRGIDVPDPTSGGGGGDTQIDQDDPKVQSAIKACQDKLPQGTGLPGGGDQ